MSKLTPLPSLAEPDLARVEPETELNIAEYLGMVRRHWKLAASTCLVGLSAASIHYAITPKQYMATANILIERRSLTPLASSQNPWFENYWNLEYYPTQYELLQSRGLAERVVKKLDLMEDRQLNPQAGGGDGAGGATAEDDEAVLGNLANGLRGGLAVDPVRGTQLVRLSYRASEPEFAAKAANAFAEAFIDMGVEDRFATAGKASSFLTSEIISLKEEIQDKESQLQAFSRRSDIVTLDSGSSVTLERLEALNGSYIDAKRQRIEKEAAYHQLAAAPRDVVADSLGGGMVTELRKEQLDLEREYETQSRIYKPEFPEMQALKAKMDEGRRNLDRLIDEKVSQARNAAFAASQTALRQEQALAGEIAKLKSEAIDQNSAGVEYTNLKAEVSSLRELMDELLQKQSETEVALRLQDTRETNVRIIDHALVPGGPFRPSLKKDLTYGLLVGLLAGLGLALLIEFFDRTIKTPEELERRLGLPTLAVIHDIHEAGKSYGYGGYGYGYGYGAGGDSGSGGSGTRVRAARAAKGAWLEKKRGQPMATGQIELVPHDQPRTLVSEAYRSLRTALSLSSARELRVVAVTSAVAGEGKTATSSNLAVVLAQLDRPVLVVDCDLRKPRIHQVFKVSNRFGLVNYLTGQAPAPDAVIFPSEVKNLWVTPSGPIPPNPSELLSSERMREWLKVVRQRFDVVILDTPPALAVTDATIVGLLADGVVLTLRCGKVTRDEARMGRDRLRQAGIKILGSVLNRYRSQRHGLGRGYRYYESYSAEPSESRAGSAA